MRQVGNKNGWKYYITKYTSKVITKLYKEPIVKNGKYQVKVVAMKDNLRGNDSKVKTFYANRVATKSALMPAVKFSSIKVTKAGTKTANAKVIAKKVYTTNTPKKLQYKVSYRIKGTSKWSATQYGSSNVKNIKGLRRGKVYTFAVRYRYQSAVDGKTNVYGKVAYREVRVR